MPPEGAGALSVRLAIATMLGVGRLPGPTGTYGTFATIPIYLLLVWPRSLLFYIAATAVVTGLSIWACSACEREFGRKDPGQAVADEMSGFLVTMLGVPPSAGALAGGFLLFRAFDVIKPFPARRLERLPGGWGIVADDLAAGVYANLALWTILLVSGAARGGAA